MDKQFDLFKPADTRTPEDRQRESWKVCWNWDGPVVGGFAEIGTPIVELESGGMSYLYMCRVKMLVLRPDGKWLAEVVRGAGKGVRVVLGICDIWFDVYGDRPELPEEPIEMPKLRRAI